MKSTNPKLQRTSEYIQKALTTVNFSKEALETTEIMKTLRALNSGVFSVAVVAPFSVGKSTFINSLLGVNLLSQNILVETATITRVKYAKIPRVEINYTNGSQVKINGNEKDVETLKKEIKRYTTVNRSKNESESAVTVENVEIYWPNDLCEKDVEIIDTPGLFGQYEAHSNATNSILSSVDTVIFMIDPANVGEENFMQIIQEYIINSNSKTSNEPDYPIFFVMNKTDQYPRVEVEKAFGELEIILRRVVKEPKIFKVSSYFALAVKMYEKNLISISDMKRDETIKFIGDEGYPITGRAIQEAHIPIISKIGNVQPIFDRIVTCSKEKNNYMIIKVFQKLSIAIELELRLIKNQVRKAKNYKSKEGYRGSEPLTEDFKYRARILREEIESITNTYLTAWIVNLEIKHALIEFEADVNWILYQLPKKRKPLLLKKIKIRVWKLRRDIENIMYKHYRQPNERVNIEIFSLIQKFELELENHRSQINVKIYPGPNNNDLMREMISKQHDLNKLLTKSKCMCDEIINL